MKMSPQRARGVYAVVGVMAVAMLLAKSANRPLLAQSASAPGGFVEAAASTAARPLLTPAQIQSFLPQRGAFTFPAPYLTTGVRLTNASDCAGGQDCVNGVGYSYWRNINNHTGSDTMLIVLGLDRQRGGQGPTLFSYNKVNGQTANLGPLFDSTSPFSWITGEDAYFSATLPTKMYLTTTGSAVWYRYDVVSHTLETVFDASTHFGPNMYIWQMHTSNDDNVHSFTVRDSSSYAMMGCGAYRVDTKQWYYFPARGDFDECQIDKSGRWLLIKENLGLGSNGDDNVVEDLQTGAEQILMDQNGAPGHSDNGYGYMVGEDNFFSLPGAVRLWNFGLPFTDGSQGKLVFYSTSWSWGSNHIAHSNAQPNVPIGQQWACSSDANRLNLPRANEVLCWRLDGSMNVLVVAPIMTNLDAPGGGTDEYWKLPKGNLDVTGQYFIWTSNLGGNRLDAFIVHVPVDKMPAAIDPGAMPIASPSPSTPSPTPPNQSTTTPPASGSSGTPSSGTAITWTAVNATLNGTTLTKTAGCNGCGDAGGTSSQPISAGAGSFQFTAAEMTSLRFAGLASSPVAGSLLPFSFRIQNGDAEVRENGVYRTDTRVAPGDTLTISTANGVVSYARNGATIYTSGQAATASLTPVVALYDMGSSVSQGMIGGAPGAASGSGTSSGSSATPSASGATWTKMVNTALVALGLTKNAGCDGCADAGAVSAQTINGGDGSVDIPAPSGGLMFAGLGTAGAPGDGAAIQFAFRFANGRAEVREGGTYRTDTVANAGDTFRVAFKNGAVIYSRNGTPFYTSATSPVYPIRVNATIYSLGATLGTPTVTGN